MGQTGGLGNPPSAFRGSVEYPKYLMTADPEDLFDLAVN